MTDSSHLMHTYARQPVSFVRGSGARLWDTEGTEYLDAIAGVAVLAGLLLHTSNIYDIPWQERLGRLLPPLVCDEAQIDDIVDRLARLLAAEHGHGPARRAIPSTA